MTPHHTIVDFLDKRFVCDKPQNRPRSGVQIGLKSSSVWPALVVLWRKHWHALGIWKELLPLQKFLTQKKKKKLIYNYCRNLFNNSLVPWTCSGACSIVMSDFPSVRKTLRHHCTAYVWYDEMWNQRTGQCRYRAVCVFSVRLCADTWSWWILKQDQGVVTV